MFRNMLIMLGLAKKPSMMSAILASRATRVAPFGGTLPILGYYAWKNRAKLMGMYNQYVAPKLPAKITGRRMAPTSSMSASY